jgi:hypothetical protein
VREDPRSYQVAVVPDSLLASLLPLLEEERWGVIQLPPVELDDETVNAWLEQVAEHVAEFQRGGYAVVLVDEGAVGARLDPALAALGVPPLPRVRGSRESLSRYAVGPPPPSGASR